MADKKVAVAVADVTVNTRLGDVQEFNGNKFQPSDSRNLGVGDSVALDDLTDEQKERVEAGEVEQLRVMSEKQADELKAKAAEAAAVAPSATPVDSSFSDHLVADVERAANLHARAVEESGGEVLADPPGLVGDDEPDSPASSGRRTASAAGDDTKEAAEKAEKK